MHLKIKKTVYSFQLPGQPGIVTSAQPIVWVLGVVICLPANGRWGECSGNMFGNSHSLVRWHTSLSILKMFSSLNSLWIASKIHWKMIYYEYAQGEDGECAWERSCERVVRFGLLLCTTAHNIQPSGHPLADSQLGGDGAVNVCV